MDNNTTAYPVVKSESQISGGMKVWSDGGLSQRALISAMMLQGMIPANKEITDKVVISAIAAADLLLKYLGTKV